MTLTRPAPGAQLSVGRLRVDAAKAIAKLREYQLVDRTAWVLEAIRAAVAANATQLELRGDANDVWLAWTGPPWAAEDLPRLFDELVSPEPTSERHHLRLLAAAVNSALGLNPAYVDVFAIGPDGATRVRYTPDVLEESTELGESALRKVAAVPATPPAGIAPSAGMLVHLRRRAALGMLSYLFWDREPPELGVARAACRDLAVPLRIGRSVHERANQLDDVVRVSLGDGLDGFVAIVDPAVRRSPEHAALMEVAERGVVLATYPIALGPSVARAPVPLRLFIDAPRMPTNASRSQVRRESHPVAAAEQQAPALVTKLIAELAARLADGTSTELMREAALALLAAEIAGPDWASMSQWNILQFVSLARLPLVRNATGAPCKLARSWCGLVYTDREPLPGSLAPWLEDVLWVPPGDPAERLVADVALDARAMRRRVKWARRQYRAHRTFFDHAPRVATIASVEPPRMRVKLGAKLAGSCVPDARFHGVSGEVCLHPHRTGGHLVLLFQGREIERVRLDSAISFDAVVDSDRFTPGDRYRGVARDDAYTRAEDATRCGVLRAVEALARELAGMKLPDGFEAAGSSPDDVNARLVREGMALALQLGFVVEPSLSAAKVWRTTEDAMVSLDEIRQHAVVGVTPSGSYAHVPKGRLVLEGGSPELLAKLAGDTRVVRYDNFRSRHTTARQLAEKLSSTGRHALEIETDGVIGAIGVAAGPSRLELCHAGTELERVTFTSRVLDACTIIVDSDAIVPDEAWRAALEDGGLRTRDFRDWEVRLVRAVAEAFAGTPPKTLHGPPVGYLESELGRALCNVLVREQVADVLGPDLLARLRARPLVRVLGQVEPVSIDQVAKWFPARMPYVDRAAQPISGFRPIVAEPQLAKAIASIAGCAAYDGKGDLELRRRTELRKQRLAMHRRLPEQPLVYAAHEPHVALDPAANPLKARGFVGVGHHGRLEIKVFVEGRAFKSVFRAGALPLIALVELDLHHTDSTFEDLSELVEAQLVTAVLGAATPLLAHLATTSPHALGDAGAPRTLLAAWTKGAPTNDEAAPREARKALRTAAAFATVHGPSTRVSLEQASHPHGAVSVASWQGDWLAPLDGESRHALDDNVIQVAAEPGELNGILTLLHMGPIIDVTNEVAKLQSQRRMARGLIPPPRLPHVSPELKRKLADLGERGKKLGHGEIGLVDGDAAISSALLHERGELRQRITLDVTPAIHLALEAPDLIVGTTTPPTPLFDLGGTLTDQLRALRDPGFSRDARTAPAMLSEQAQELAIQLVRAVLRDRVPHDWLPAGVRRSLAHAVISRRLEPADVTGVPLLETIDGDWVDWQVLVEQLAKFGEAWAVSQVTLDRPIAEDRLVFVLPASEIEAARGAFAIIDARQELALDATARRNRERYPVERLDFHNRHGVIAEVELDGDGITAPRGVVGALAPAAVERRGVYAHRALHPFDLANDPCDWPTLAVIDDARLEPDRTWSRPLTGGAWQDVIAQLRAATERALATLVEPPHEALAVERLTRATQDSAGWLRGSRTQVRGALWLVGGPRRIEPLTVRVIDAYSTLSFVPPHNLGMGGVLYVHAPDSWHGDKLLEELCASVHAALVKQLIGRTDLDSDLISAHVAHALALARLQPVDVPTLTFDCFRPSPLRASALTAVLRGSGPHQIVGVADDPDVVGVVEDGSELARVVIATLGTRARYGRPERPKLRPVPRPEPAPPTAAPRPAIVPPKPPPPPKPDHAIQILVDAVHDRLVELGVPVPDSTIVDAEQPLVRFDRALRFAGESARLHAIANALRANSPWAPLAVDALAAHATTVLNAALQQVTDQTERDVLGKLLVGA